MKKIRFLTLHPAGTDVDLTKDEGQIPYTLCSNYPIDAKIVSCHINNETANLNAVPGLIVEHIPYIINNAVSGLLYLILNSKKIDWLNIYFAGRQAYIWTKVFKKLNNKGKVYLKLDMDFRSSDLYDKNKREKNIFSKCTEAVDLVSVESEALKNRIQKYTSKEIIVIGNGISKPKFYTNIKQSRENTFLTVARLGTKQKATDILLQGFAKTADMHNWNLKLIGTIDDNFRKYITSFFVQYPNLKERIQFLGPINDRERLYNEYCKAKVFVLPSRWESYGISCAEAVSCGCRLILTNTIPPAKEMTNGEKFGKIIEVNSVDALGDALLKESSLQVTYDDIDEMVNYANIQFSWDKICGKLYKNMKSEESL